MERFNIVDTSGNITGVATREECHNGSFLLHPVVHVLVFNDKDELILQKRSMSKYIQPGKWDTSIGGHINAGETLGDALERESSEELGIVGAQYTELYTYIMQSDIERERITTYRCSWRAPLLKQDEEIDEIRAFSRDEIEGLLGTGFFTPNFEEEWARYKQWERSHPSPNNRGV